MSREVKRESNVFHIEEKVIEGMRCMVMMRIRREVNWGLGMFVEMGEAQ